MVVPARVRCRFPLVRGRTVAARTTTHSLVFRPQRADRRLRKMNREGLAVFAASAARDPYATFTGWPNEADRAMIAPPRA